MLKNYYLQFEYQSSIFCEFVKIIFILVDLQIDELK